MTFEEVKRKYELLPAGSEDYLILPALRSLAQAAFAGALLYDQEREEALDKHLTNVVTVDKNDCAKRLICELNSADRRFNEPLAWDENLLANVALSQATKSNPRNAPRAPAFGTSAHYTINYGSPSMHLQVAAIAGRKANREGCTRSYNRCPIEPDVALLALRKRGISLEIQDTSDLHGSDGEGKLTCSALFLWSKYGLKAEDIQLK